MTIKNLLILLFGIVGMLLFGSFWYHSIDDLALQKYQSLFGLATVAIFFIACFLFDWDTKPVGEKFSKEEKFSIYNRMLSMHISMLLRSSREAPEFDSLSQHIIYLLRAVLKSKAIDEDEYGAFMYFPELNISSDEMDEFHNYSLNHDGIVKVNTQTFFDTYNSIVYAIKLCSPKETINMELEMHDNSFPSYYNFLLYSQYERVRVYCYFYILYRYNEGWRNGFCTSFYIFMLADNNPDIVYDPKCGYDVISCLTELYEYKPQVVNSAFWFPLNPVGIEIRTNICTELLREAEQYFESEAIKVSD